MPRREKLPDDLNELATLCRAGKLFAVQDWIKQGRRYQVPPGNFTWTPLKVAIDSGFHSLVQVLLEAGAATQEEKDRALSQAVSNRSLDLLELLAKHGADPLSIDADELFWSRHPQIIRWFINRGFDLETNNPIAHALANRQREFLGIYLDVRDRVPTARRQAAMALRHHVQEGNIKWVCLLLWAGADPRMLVPRPDEPDDCDDYLGTALRDAVRQGRIDIVRKFKVNAALDNLNELLCECWLTPQPEITQMLISLGGDARARVGERTPIQAAFSCFEWSLDHGYSFYGSSSTNTEAALRTIEILAEHGARWEPDEACRFRYFRRGLASVSGHNALCYLHRIVKSGAIEQPIFQELMRTPRMKELLRDSAPGVSEVRKHAGWTDQEPRRRQQRYRAQVS